MGLFSKLFGNNNKQTTTAEPVEPKFTVSVSTSEPGIPKYRGAYAQANFLYTYRKASPIKKNDDYQRYIIYDFGIREPADYHKKMIKEGYLGPASVSEQLEGLKLQQLKDILGELQLPKTGKKADLIKRIEDSTDEKWITEYLKKDEVYSITEKGLSYINENADYVELHKSGNRYTVSYEEYSMAKASNPQKSYGDLIWGIFQSRIYEQTKKGKIDVFDELCMYYFLYDEQRYTDALDHLIRYVYMNLNAANEIMDYIRYFKTSNWPKEKYVDSFSAPRCYISDRCVSMIFELKDDFKPEMIHRAALSSPVHFCSEKEFGQVIEQIFSGTFDRVAFEEEINSRVKPYLKKYLKR